MSGLGIERLDAVMAEYAQMIDNEVKYNSQRGLSDGYVAADFCRDIFRRTWMRLSAEIEKHGEER